MKLYSNVTHNAAFISNVVQDLQSIVYLWTIDNSPLDIWNYVCDWQRHQMDTIQ